jgi:hypothetical protein
MKGYWITDEDGEFVWIPEIYKDMDPFDLIRIEEEGLAK